jgi:tryptophan-rich sensory protein
LKVSKFAGVLLLPYLLWVSFATLLNFSLWILNH